MDARSINSCFIVRTAGGESEQRIVVYNLRNQEVREFSSWDALLDYLRISSPVSSLR